ncbi:hypothetical protein DCC78_08825 [bacterium]|nr:MAG: hypothetical protein DCC78_08825 [bacterium]
MTFSSLSNVCAPLSASTLSSALCGQPATKRKPLTTEPQDERLDTDGRVCAWLGSYPAIGLEEIADVAFHDRRDTKFLLSGGQLQKILAAVRPFYRVLEINGTRLQAYRTLYFDSDDLDFYMAHHNGKPGRCKVRSRQYLETGDTFLEVKRRAPRGRTSKVRLRTPEMVTEIAPSEQAFIAMQTIAHTSPLVRQLENRFKRATLVDLCNHERVTIDVQIELLDGHRRIGFPNVFVVEVKEGGEQRASPFIEQLRAMNIHPSSFSKYCVGIALLRPRAKRNRFKPHLRRLASMATGGINVDQLI